MTGCATYASSEVSDSWKYHVSDERFKIVVPPYQISSQLLQFVKDWEWYYPIPYHSLDTQNWTIGYGHVITHGETYTCLSESQASNLLWKDLQGAVNDVNSWNIAGLSQWEFDALVDIDFNVGETQLLKGRLVRDIKAGASFEQLRIDFEAFSYCNGAFSSGLFKRRKQEWMMYTQLDYIGTH